MGYFARERFFTGCGPNFRSLAVVFTADDLTEDECKTLAASVQKCLDQLQEDGGAGPWFFELGPSAQDDAAAFINLKSEWETTQKEFHRYEQSSVNSWQSDIVWFNRLAEEHAEIIRGMRAGHMPTVYLQCDGGRGFETFDCVDSLTWPEIETLEAVLEKQLYEHAMQFRLISDWEAERKPATYVQAKLSWKLIEEDLKNDNADEMRLVAFGISCECVEEIKALRKKPAVYGSAEDGERNENLLTVEDEDDGSRTVVVDIAGATSWGPLPDEVGVKRFDGTFDWNYDDQLFRLHTGSFIRVRNLQFRSTAKRLSDAEAAEWLFVRRFGVPSDIAHHVENHRFRENLLNGFAAVNAIADQNLEEPWEPSGELKTTYRDPDNYERNIWLYRQREAGKTNAAILASLKAEGSKFIQLETENALRAAIDSIARHHRWPELKGRPGRRKASAGSGQDDR